jgi:pyruvate kinase
MKQPVTVKDGSTWHVFPGNEESKAGTFTISYRELLKDAQPGQTILVDDGKLRFEITEKTKTNLVIRATQGGELSGHKGVFFPDMQLTASSLTEKDFVDLTVGIDLGFDYVALSFVRRSQDVRYLREFLHARKRNCGIIAKIEREEALDNIEGIIEEADAIMVARGDMAVELGPENVPLIQKSLIRQCNAAAKPVITATEMLLSMVTNSTPTRAEASDVANAILDGSDAVMLSNETAVGKHPATVVAMMDRIIRQVETQERGRHHSKVPQTAGVAEAVIHSAFDTAERVEARAIFSVSRDDLAPRLLSKYRPQVPLFAVVDSAEACRHLKLVWGVQSIHVNPFPRGSEVFDRILNEARSRQLANPGDKLVITAGLPDLKESPTNTVKVMEIE